MKALIVYDSVHGNTEEIAKSMGEAIGGTVRVVRVGESGLDDLESVNLLIAGAPTYGGRPTPNMKEFLDNIGSTSLNGVIVAAFDTRLPATWVKIFGFAAGKIEKRLRSRGGISVVKPEGFFVSGTRGPLAEGERARAGKWAREIAEKI